MRRLLGRLTWGVSLGVLLASIGAGQARAAYQISISIMDSTHPSNSYSTTISSTSALNTTPGTSTIAVNSGLFNGASTSDVTVSGLTASMSQTAASSSLGIGGEITLASSGPNTMDSYTITITTTFAEYTQPTGPSGTLGQSESGTYTYTNSTGTQTFQSWYAPGNVPGDTGAGTTTPGQQSIPIPATSAIPLSGFANTPGSAVVTPVVPFTLTNTMIITLTGTGAANGSDVKFQGSTTIMASAVPEPASLLMFLTGMPMPLMVLGMLRRRKAQREGCDRLRIIPVAMSFDRLLRNRAGRPSSRWGSMAGPA